MKNFDSNRAFLNLLLFFGVIFLGSMLFAQSYYFLEDFGYKLERTPEYTSELKVEEVPEDGVIVPPPVTYDYRYYDYGEGQDDRDTELHLAPATKKPLIL